MATGFSVMDALNKNTKAGMEQEAGGRFRTKDISIYKLYRNELNFYKIDDIEELADKIYLDGLRQNLEVAYDPCERGEYRIIAGERRWEALKYLAAQGYKNFETATCKICAPQDIQEEQIEIITANSYRDKTDYELVEEERRLKTALEELRQRGKKYKGRDLRKGPLREVIAQIMRRSETKIAQIEAVWKNLLPELQEELKKGTITFSAAYALSGMSKEEQKEVYEAGNITHKEVKKKKEELKQQKNVIQKSVSESNNENPDDNASAEWEEDFENPGGGENPEKKNYSNEKTKEQKYEEEQAKIDRETKRKLQEMEDEEKMRHLPSDTPIETRRHTERISPQEAEEIRSGARRFAITKEGPYRVNDTMEYLIFKGGANTGNIVKCRITFVMEEHTGLEEGYCILGIEAEDDQML